MVFGCAPACCDSTEHPVHLDHRDPNLGAAPEVA
jgi:hypothetical protein